LYPGRAPVGAAVQVVGRATAVRERVPGALAVSGRVPHRKQSGGRLMAAGLR
jgi:hypothetical protein